MIFYETLGWLQAAYFSRVRQSLGLWFYYEAIQSEPPYNAWCLWLAKRCGVGE